MKWFLKALSHYADFSGRARRKEYWMFVLFNIIFYFVWGLLFTIAFAFVNRNLPHLEIAIQKAAPIAFLSYGIVMLLPGLALAVRRMHDLGKSGWMLLVGLIPLIGGIWMFVLTLLDGQPQENRYGPNPKTSPETFSNQAKLKSAGVTLIVVSAIVLLLDVIFWVIRAIRVYSLPIHDWVGQLVNILSPISAILLLVAGSYLLHEKTNSEIQDKRKRVVTLLLVSVSIWLVMGIFSWIKSIYYSIQYEQTISQSFIITIIIAFISFLSIALFATSVLFSPKNKDLIFKTAVLAIELSSLRLLWTVYYDMYNAQYIQEWMEQLQHLFGTFYILMQVAFIVLVGTFLSIKREKKTVIAKERPQAVNFNSPPPPPPPPSPKPKSYPPPVTPQSRNFPLYTGSGVCDVCNNSLSGRKAYIVPNHVFYNSRKYRDYMRNSAMAKMMGIPINDAYFAQMQARDHSQGSAVCEDCIHMF